MTNEIKEIIEYLKDKNIYIEEHDYCYKRLSLEECNTISNYITNLQEEIKEWEYIQDIQNKREYRKRYLEERRKEDPTLLYPDYDEIYKRFFEQRDRIDKALKFIKLHDLYHPTNEFILINILQGNNKKVDELINEIKKLQENARISRNKKEKASK